MRYISFQGFLCFQDVVRLVHSGVGAHLEDFLWGHISVDFEVIQAALGKGFDDVLVLLHHLLDRMHNDATHGMLIHHMVCSYNTRYAHTAGGILIQHVVCSYIMQCVDASLCTLINQMVCLHIIRDHHTSQGMLSMLKHHMLCSYITGYLDTSHTMLTNHMPCSYITNYAHTSQAMLIHHRPCSNITRYAHTSQGIMIHHTLCSHITGHTHTLHGMLICHTVCSYITLLHVC